MSTVVVRYKVKAERADENIRYIEAVFNALKESTPDGIRYLSMVAEDGVSFTHIATIDGEDGSNPLPGMPEFQAFVADIAERCDEPPAPTPSRIVGNYRMGT